MIYLVKGYSSNFYVCNFDFFKLSEVVKSWRWLTFCIRAPTKQSERITHRTLQPVRAFTDITISINKDNRLLCIASNCFQCLDNIFPCACRPLCHFLK